jgi:hypothetical protein
MPEKFSWLGFELMYPENWRAELDEEAETLSIVSPSGAFLSMMRPASIDSAFSQAKSAMETEYEEIETETVTRLVGEGLLEGITQRFIYLDFVVTSHLLKLESESEDFAPLLIQIQGEDRDLDQQQPVFDAILTSLLQSVEQ